jgi:Holliday junction resolvase-like predicted endonuclease
VGEFDVVAARGRVITILELRAATVVVMEDGLAITVAAVDKYERQQLST